MRAIVVAVAILCVSEILAEEPAKFAVVDVSSVLRQSRHLAEAEAKAKENAVSAEKMLSECPNGTSATNS
ncbi:MAG: hypothetical protein ACI9R3_001049 [Verrucomicrobiales bacterium]|jgi:hypothetical protein